MHRFVGLCALAVAVALVAMPAFAEVQNVKVSGDIDAKYIAHNNFDLKETQLNAPPGILDNVTQADDASAFLQTTRVRVDADLTDNVSATVRLRNQRFWDADGASDTNDIDLDFGYVTLKELIYSPLTVTAGRQPVHYGTGFVVGYGGFLRNANGAFSSNIGVGPHGTHFQEFSEDNSYDAIRATLDFSPLVADLLYAKINEVGAKGSAALAGDQDLYGVNLNWKGVPLDQFNGEAELYWFYKNDQAFNMAVHDSGRTWDENRVHTIGGRVAGDPITNLHLNGEVAFQLGELVDNAANGVMYRERDRSAWALNVSGNYTLATVPWTPTAGVGFVHYSGEEAGSQGGLGNDADDFDAWDAMYRSSFTTYIQDFFGGTDAANLYTTVDGNDTAANTNRQLLYFDLGLKPLQDLTLWGRFTHVWFDETPVAGRSDTAGDEFDAKLVYDYTEDVQLGLAGAWFFPGGYYDDNPAPETRGDATAWETLGSLSVKF